MADTVGYFQIVNMRETVGPLAGKAAVASSLYNGMLVKLSPLDGDGSTLPDVTAATAADNPKGIVIANRREVYRPTAKTALYGEAVSVYRGHIQALVDATFFIGGTLPARGSELYSAAGGLMDTSGTYKVGSVLAHQDLRTPPNSVGNLAFCEFHFAEA